MFEIFDSVHNMGKSYAWEKFEAEELQSAMENVAYDMEAIARDAVSPMSQSQGASGVFENSFVTEIDPNGEVTVSLDLPYGGDIYNTGDQFNAAGDCEYAPYESVMDWVDRAGLVDMGTGGPNSRYHAVAKTVNAGGEIAVWQEDVANETDGLLMDAWEQYLEDNFV